MCTKKTWPSHIQYGISLVILLNDNWKRPKNLIKVQLAEKPEVFFKNSKNFKEKKLVLVLFPKTIYLQLLETYERRCTYFTCFKPGIWMKHFFYIRNETKD